MNKTGFTKIDVSKELLKELHLLSISDGRLLYSLTDEVIRLGLEVYRNKKEK